MGSDVLTEMFHDFLQMELAVKKLYESLAGRAEDKAVKVTLFRIAEDEARHAENARKILRILGAQPKP